MTSLSFLIINILNIQISIISQGQFLLFLLSNSTPLCFKKMNSLFFFFIIFFIIIIHVFLLFAQGVHEAYTSLKVSKHSIKQYPWYWVIYLFICRLIFSFLLLDSINFLCSKIFMLLFFIFIFIVIYMIICVRKRSISNSCQIIHYDNQFIITHTMSR